MLFILGIVGGLLVGIQTDVRAVGARCEKPPVDVRLEQGDPPAGGAEFRATDGVARRVPILVGREEPGRTPAELRRLERQAAKTKLALYQIYLADFRLPRRDVRGPSASAFFTPTPTADEVAATLSIVPTKPRGFKPGDVVTLEDDLEYETTTTFSTVGLGIITADGESASGEPSGQVKVLALDAREICVDVDFELTVDGAIVAAIEGTFAVPVVRPENKSLYFF
jgi:hypothetical protein